MNEEQLLKERARLWALIEGQTRTVLVILEDKVALRKLRKHQKELGKVELELEILEMRW